MQRSQLYNLHPFIDKAGSLKVGGRLERSNLPYAEKHQLVLPKHHHLTRIIAINYHEAYMHHREPCSICSENAFAACFVPLHKSLIENATMAMYSHAYIHVLGTWYR
jgi:hypothetical protein